jgi:membrane protein YdbS with pleckstrin-like domain
MTQFFAKDWSGTPFIFFSAAHIVALLVVVLLNVFLISRYKNAPEKARRTVAYVMAGVLWANELSWHL